MLEPDHRLIDARARAVLDAHGGVAHVSAFDAAGITRRQTALLLRRGVLERPRIGWYADPALPWQVKRAVRVGGAACCVTAAALLGLPVPPGAHLRLHVHVEEHDSRLRHNRDRRWVLASVEDDTELEVHWGALRGPIERGRTSLVDTLLLLPACVSEEWFIAALDAALHVPRGGAPLLDGTGLDALAAALPRRLRRLVEQVDPLAESCIETLLRLGLHRRRIGPFVLQAVVDPRFRVDFLLDDRLIVEVDGEAFHDAERDRLRDAALRALGYRVLRFPYRRVVDDLEAVLDEIEAALVSF